jgi:hypothetical protein
MWENVFFGIPWNPAGALWLGHGGSIIGSPNALLDGATYAYVQGSDTAMWRKVFATSAPSFSMVDASENSNGSSEVNMVMEDVAGNSNA